MGSGAALGALGRLQSMLGGSRMLVRVFWDSWTLPAVLQGDLESPGTLSELHEAGYQDWYAQPGTKTLKTNDFLKKNGFS